MQRVQAVAAKCVQTGRALGRRGGNGVVWERQALRLGDYACMSPAQEHMDYGNYCVCT